MSTQLHNSTLSAFPVPSDIASVNAKTTILEAFKVLDAKSVYSVPVIEDKKCVGLLDLCDIIAYWIHLFQEKTGHKAIKEINKHNLQKQFEANPYKPQTGSTKLIDCLHQLTTEIRRIPIVSDDGVTITRLVSLADMMRFWHANMDALPKLNDEISKISKPAQFVSSTTRAIDCYFMMNEMQVSALPIVDDSDDDQMVVGVITLRDFTLAMEDFDNVLLGAEDYIAKLRQRNISTLREFPFISVQESDSIETTVSKMIATRLHRVFVKREKGKIDVVTIKDILVYLAQ